MSFSLKNNLHYNWAIAHQWLEPPLHSVGGCVCGGLSREDVLHSAGGADQHVGSLLLKLTGEEKMAFFKIILSHYCKSFLTFLRSACTLLPSPHMMSICLNLLDSSSSSWSFKNSSRTPLICAASSLVGLTMRAPTWCFSRGEERRCSRYSKV